MAGQQERSSRGIEASPAATAHSRRDRRHRATHIVAAAEAAVVGGAQSGVLVRAVGAVLNAVASGVGVGADSVGLTHETAGFDALPEDGPEVREGKR